MWLASSVSPSSVVGSFYGEGSVKGVVYDFVASLLTADPSEETNIIGLKKKKRLPTSSRLLSPVFHRCYVNYHVLLFAIFLLEHIFSLFQEFAQQMFQHCEALRPLSAKYNELFEHFKSWKGTIPTAGELIECI